MLVYYISFCAIAAITAYLWKRSQKQNQQNPLLSQEAFTCLCLEKLRMELPQYHFQQEAAGLISSANEGQYYQTSTNNLYRQYLQNPAAKDSLIAQIAIMPHLSQIQGNTRPEIKDILPIVRNVQQAAQLMKTLSETAGNQHLALAQYNSDLAILYVLDAEAQFRYLTIEELPDLGLDIHTIHDVALTNLRKKLKALNISLIREGLYAVKCDNVYESSMILLDELWTKQNFPFVKNLIMAVSNRNLVLVSSSDHTAILHSMMKIATECYQKEAYPISPLLYQQKAGKFERVEVVSIPA